MPDNGLHCWVYRSPRKQEMYLYLAEEDTFDKVPDELLQRFGEPQQRLGPVGEPPISHWVYPDFVVYYEYDRVIHAVVPRR